MKKRVFRTNARTPECIEAIGLCLSRALRPEQWEVEVVNDEVLLKVSSPKPDGLIVQLVREAGYTASPLVDAKGEKTGLNPYDSNVKNYK